MKTTPYKQVWDRFSMSHEFVEMLNLQSLGTDPKYLINRFQRAFDAGWNAKTSLILDALNATIDRDSQATGED